MRYRHLSWQPTTFARLFSDVFELLLVWAKPRKSRLTVSLYTAELLDIIKKEDMKAHSYADDTQVHLSTGASNARFDGLSAARRKLNHG